MAYLAAHVWNATLPALGECGVRREGSPRTLALSPGRVPRAVPCALSLELVALQPPWEPPETLRGVGKSLCVCRGASFLISRPHTVVWCVCPWGTKLSAQRDSPMEFVLQPGSGDP